MTNYDLIGNIALFKFPDGFKIKEKKKFAKSFLEKHRAIRTVLEKKEKFSGRLRTLKTRYLAGENTKEALYKENSCEFRFNIDTCYFSTRLNSERKEIALQVKKGERVLVMFAGVAPYSIVIAKHSKAKEVVSIELSRECSKYAKENVRRNKVLDRVQIVQGDVRKKIGKGKEIDFKFDRIVMARPNLSDDFLDVAFQVCKKGTIIHYYGFYHELEFKAGVLDALIEDKAKKSGKKIKILKKKRAGDIAPYKFRYRVDFKVMN